MRAISAGGTLVFVLGSGCLPSQQDYLDLRDELKDLDGDTFVSSQYGGADCDDRDPEVHPAAEEVCTDERDNDCDGLVDDAASVDATSWCGDGDGDGFGDQSISVTSCTAPTDFVADCRDCDDDDAAVRPDTVWFVDSDGDGHGDEEFQLETCDPGQGYVLTAGDCNDNDDATFPGADEWCGGGDEDCDSLVDEEGAIDASQWFLDADGDGYGDAASSVTSCEAPEDHVPDSGDCRDDVPAVNPGAEEVCLDRVDDDCDGTSLGCIPEGDVSVSDLETVIEGQGPTEGLGRFIALLEDYDGDSKADLLVGTNDGARIHRVKYKTQAEFIGSAGFGAAGTGTMDLSGDGVDDVVIGSPESDVSCSECGEVLIYEGPAIGTLGESDVWRTLSGGEAGQRLGTSLLASTAMDSGGSAVLIVGGEGDGDTAGAIEFYEVASPGELSSDDLAGAIREPEPGWGLGGLMILMGDANGDGFEDLAAALPGEPHNNGSATGAVRVFAGLPGEELQPADSWWNIRGESPADLVGTSVSTAGDWDGDGYADLFIGAPGVTHDTQDQGAAAVCRGGTGGEVALADCDALIYGPTTESGFGSAVAGGDLDRASGADVLVAAPGIDAGVADSGTVYLFMGPVSGVLGVDDAIATLTGAAEGDGIGINQAGLPVLAFGSYSADSFDDILIGAAAADGTAGVDAGAVYIQEGAGY